MMEESISFKSKEGLPVCVSMWFFKLPGCVERYSHSGQSQACGFSPKTKNELNYKLFSCFPTYSIDLPDRIESNKQTNKLLVIRKLTMPNLYEFVYASSGCQIVPSCNHIPQSRKRTVSCLVKKRST